MAEAESLLTTLSVSALAGSIVLVWFIIARRRFPRFYLSNLQSPEYLSHENGTGLFNWISYTWSFPEFRLLHTYGGMDQITYLHFMKYSACLFAVYSLMGLAALVPVNVTGGFSNEKISFYEHGGLERLSMGNIIQGSHRLWLHLSFVFIFTVFAWFYVFSKDEQYQGLKHIQATSNSVQSRTVMISHIPNHLRTAQTLTDYFSARYPDKVVYATVVPQLGKLRELQKRREQLVQKWKEANAKYQSTSERPFHRTGRVPCTGERVDSLVYYRNQIETLDEQIRAELKRLETSPNIPSTSVGFVTFNSIKTALECLEEFSPQLLPLRSHSNPYRLRARPAPEPHDIEWTALGMTQKQYQLRRLVVFAILVALFLFWSIPVTFINAFYNLNDLIKVPRFVMILIGSLVPSSSLALFLTVLPDILYTVISRRGFYLKTQLERSVLRTYWLFLIVNVFLLSVVASSLFDSLQSIFHDPQSVWKLFSASIPKQALFFASYIILQIFFGYPSDLARLKKLTIYWAKSISTRHAPENHPAFKYAENYAQALLIFAIGMCYSVMSPIILPFVCAYFAVGWFVAKYNFIFVRQPKYEGLKMTSMAINRIMCTLLLFQGIMIGEFSLKYFPPGFSVALLILGTTVYWYFLRRKFTKRGKFVALSNALLRAQVENLGEEGELAKAISIPSESHPPQQMDSKEPLINTIREMYEDPALKMPTPLGDYLSDYGALHLELQS